MNNLKKRIFAALAVIMIGIAIFPIVAAYAANVAPSGCQISMEVKIGSTEMVSGGKYLVKGGEKITVNATSSYADIVAIGYRYEENGVKGPITDVLDKEEATITIPTKAAGTILAIEIEAVNKNDKGNPNTVTKTGWIPFYLVYGDINAKVGTSTLTPKSTTNVKVGSQVTVQAVPDSQVAKIYYSWDNNGTYEIKNSELKVTVPSDFKVGSTHTLYVTARYTNGKDLANKEYYFKIVGDVEDDTIDDDDDLIIEPWMRENKDLSTLAVSLRNDSEGTKYNKNMYELDEEILYFVDYKNGGKDIKSKVTLVLNLPLAFEVVDSDGGVVDKSAKTITWTWNNGLEADQAGTKEVIVKYTSLGKASLDYKIINPVADIKKDTKIVDSSAVVNLIFKEVGEEIDDTHYPYMYGDKNATTFRPDDTITRAEGALVLTRIFGIYTNSIKITSVYPDLDQTYEEAQKAIIAATSYGMINGYTDGSYRPNAPMTRAEFMKIIARRVEIQAEDDDIRGLEVKDSDNSIKIYKNPVSSYVVNGQTVNEHWALGYITLLARINMTSVSNKEKDLRLDDYITRAEVAQLVNFYLLRAPAKVTSSTRTNFSDVLRTHKLFADIVEATMSAHTYSITEDGREIAE